MRWGERKRKFKIGNGGTTREVRGTERDRQI